VISRFSLQNLLRPANLSQKARIFTGFLAFLTAEYAVQCGGVAAVMLQGTLNGDKIMANTTAAPQPKHKPANSVPATVTPKANAAPQPKHNPANAVPQPKHKAPSAAAAAAEPKVKGMTKAQIRKAIADKLTYLTVKQAGEVLDALAEICVEQLQTKGIGDFTIPGLVKVVKVHKKATPAMTKPNPFKKGEMKDYPAKPARTTIKVRALKALKDTVQQS
jgi:nucleoid DNA-binding protein